MRIYLIGMPGSGKSTVGKQLAKVLGYPFLDLDTEIEKKSLMFISDIIAGYGEETFRKIESQTLSEITLDAAVISTGGGVIKNKENKKSMEGIRIFLNTELDIIKERIQMDAPRPLLKDKTLDELFDERLLKYLDFATDILDNDGDIDSTTLRIRTLLKEKYKI